MSLSEQQITERVEALLTAIDKELVKRSFEWSIEAYDYIKRDFINADIFEPFSEDYFDEYESDDELHDTVVDNFEAAAYDLAQMLHDQDGFVHETADSSRVTFMYGAAQKFYNYNTSDCNAAAVNYDVDTSKEDWILTANYYVLRDRIQEDVDDLARFFEEIDGGDYL